MSLTPGQLYLMKRSKARTEEIEIFNALSITLSIAKHRNRICEVELLRKHLKPHFNDSIQIPLNLGILEILSGVDIFCNAISTSCIIKERKDVFSGWMRYARESYFRILSSRPGECTRSRQRQPSCGRCRDTPRQAEAKWCRRRSNRSEKISNSRGFSSSYGHTWRRAERNHRGRSCRADVTFHNRVDPTRLQSTCPRSASPSGV